MGHHQLRVRGHPGYPFAVVLVGGGDAGEHGAQPAAVSPRAAFSARLSSVALKGLAR